MSKLPQAAGGAARATAQGGLSCAYKPLKSDFHLHSTFSDGVHPPETLCRMAVKTGVQALALTDHDTADGVPAMQEAASALGLICLPGAEVSTGTGGKVHVLAYGPAVLSSGMQDFLKEIRADRQSRAAEMLNRLEREGIAFPGEAKARLLQNPSVGRPHIARAMIELGVVNTVRQAFDRYLGDGKPGCVPRRPLLTRDAVQKIRMLGCVPVLAHPTQAGLEWTALCALMEDLIQCGLMGIEAWHSCVTPAQARQLDAFARRSGLLVTGGSDYHGDAGSTVQLGRLPSGRPEGDAERLLNATRI